MEVFDHRKRSDLVNQLKAAYEFFRTHMVITLNGGINIREASMKTLLKVGFALTALLMFTACSAWPRAGNNGAFYTKVSSPVAVFENESPEPLRYGQACSSGILGLYASGDSTIARARTNGSITKIITIEEQFKQVLLGAYAQYCTVVGGY